MADLEIVHLSDLHWSLDRAKDRTIVIDALIRDLKRLKDNQEIAPDVVVFSGDLAQSGDDPLGISGGIDALLRPVLDVLNLDTDRLFICPGNHDIARERVRSAQFVETGLRSELKSVDAVNAFVDSLNLNLPSHTPAVSRIENFYSLIDAFIPDPCQKSATLRCYSRQLASLNIGVACFDTAWRATGESEDADRNHLIIGERNVDIAIEALSGSDIRIAVMHHPLDWLADFDEYAVSSRLSSNFDLILCGHTHRTLPQTRTTAQGSAIISQTGSVYATRRWFNGYHIIKIDAAAGECKFIVRTYFDAPRREFDPALNAVPGGQVTFPYQFGIMNGGLHLVESVLREVRPNIRRTAADHMNIIGAEGADVLDIKEGFVVPPLTIKSISEDADKIDEPSRFEEIRPEDILRSTDNFIITGDRETGKTSLLHYLSVLIAEGNCDVPRIPVIVSCANLKSGSYNLKRVIGGYLGNLPKGIDVEEALKAGHFLFLADELSNSSQAAIIQAHISEFGKNRWICIDQPRLGAIQGRAQNAENLPTFREVRIGTLPRRSIRALAKRWSPTIGQSDEHVFDTVMGQIRRDALPRTGYIVTLLLWAMRQETEFDRINEAVLLSNVVDHLLGKADFTQATRGTFDPRSKEIVLEHLATFFHDRGDVVDIDAVTHFLVDLFKSKMLPFKSVDVLGELIKCGILDRSEDTVFFKYRCFQEYFYASRMRFDQDCFDASISNGRYRLLPREFELLSGLVRENKNIISKIEDDLDRHLPEDVASLSSSEFDALTEVNVAVSVSEKRIDELKKKRLSADQVDDLMDAADRRAMKRAAEEEERRASLENKGKANETVDLFGAPSSEDRSGADNSARKMSPSEYVQSTDILARVIRNSDFTDFDVKGPATRRVLQNTVKVCLLIRRELVELLDEAFANGQKPDGQKSDGLSQDEKNALMGFLSRLMVNGSAIMISDQLSSPNIVLTAKEILAEGGLCLAEKIYLTFLLQACKSTDWHDHFVSLLKDRPDSGFLVECVLGRVQRIVHTQFLDDQENAKVRAVIDAAQEVLGWGAQQKSQVLTDLRKAALQADLRDQLS